MFHIKSFISKFLEKNGIKNQLQAAEVCKIADRLLKETFGNQHPKALFFRNETLQIKCSNPILANEVQIRKEEIRNRINDELNKILVKNIITKIK